MTRPKPAPIIPIRRLPVLRADCEPGGHNAARPCPFPGCRHWLSGDCVLDIAARGPSTLQEIGERMQITRERARQLEEVAIRKLRHRAALLGIAIEDLTHEWAGLHPLGEMTP